MMEMNNSTHQLIYKSNYFLNKHFINLPFVMLTTLKICDLNKYKSP